MTQIYRRIERFFSYLQGQNIYSVAFLFYTKRTILFIISHTRCGNNLHAFENSRGLQV
jgi:hypothetical protein